MRPPSCGSATSAANATCSRAGSTPCRARRPSRKSASRYRGDREFKQTVDRYIGEFERLLEEVSQDERGQATARSYLTSDTGKVYTMLAHAAGRLE